MRWDAKLYDSVVSPQIDAGRRLVEMAKVDREESLLDLGCGTGTLTAELASRARWGTVVGLDSSNEMIDRAGRRLEGFGNVNLVLKDAGDMDYEHEFDLVFSSSVLHWIPDQKDALRRIYRALRPGGRVAVQLIEKDFFPEFGRYVKEAISEIGAESYFEAGRPEWFMPTREEYEGLLRAIGFSAPEVTLWEQRCVFRSMNDVFAWLSSTGLRPFLEHLPEREQERFRYAFTMRFENQRTRHGIEVVLRRLFAVAFRKAPVSEVKEMGRSNPSCYSLRRI